MESSPTKRAAELGRVLEVMSLDAKTIKIISVPWQEKAEHHWHRHKMLSFKVPVIGEVLVTQNGNSCPGSWQREVFLIFCCFIHFEPNYMLSETCHMDLFCLFFLNSILEGLKIVQNCTRFRGFSSSPLPWSPFQSQPNHQPPAHYFLMREKILLKVNGMGFSLPSK